MSTINTNGINVNYPVPGQNQSSQGFRNNFSGIVQNLNIAASEITDLQNKAVLKSALANSTLSNDMANTLISNASTRSFRSTTYNLGNALAGTVLINASLGDVQYGTVASNVTLQFGSWSPAQTQQNIQLQFNFSNANAYVIFPSSVVSSNNNYGVTIIENYANIGNVATVKPPYGVTQLNYQISTTDCGNTLYITPLNRPYESTQVQTRLVPPTGLPGDMSGTVAVNNIPPITIANTINTGNYVVVATGYTTANLYPDLAIRFTGNTDSSNSNITAGTLYYVNAVSNSSAFTISSSVGGSQVDVGTTTNSFEANPVNYLYVSVGSYNSTDYTSIVANTNVSGNIGITGNVSYLTVNSPVIFSGNVANSNINVNKVYYIKSINTSGSNANITIAYSRSNGIAGTQVSVNTVSTLSNCTMNTLVSGNDIFKRTELYPW
jgi:hypothetical protein